MERSKHSYDGSFDDALMSFVDDRPEMSEFAKTNGTVGGRPHCQDDASSAMLAMTQRKTCSKKSLLRS
jgi:hypothetical protein